MRRAAAASAWLAIIARRGAPARRHHQTQSEGRGSLFPSPCPTKRTRCECRATAWCPGPTARPWRLRASRVAEVAHEDRRDLRRRGGWCLHAPGAPASGAHRRCGVHGRGVVGALVAHAGGARAERALAHRARGRRLRRDSYCPLVAAAHAACSPRAAFGGARARAGSRRGHRSPRRSALRSHLAFRGRGSRRRYPHRGTGHPPRAAGSGPRHHPRSAHVHHHLRLGGSTAMPPFAPST